MLRRTGYGKAVDFWSLGALCFEMMIGRPPFEGKSTKEIEEKILTTNPKFPPFLRSEATQLMKGLLARNPEKRLGATKATMFEVQHHTAHSHHHPVSTQHPFFSFLSNMFAPA
jgi:serine/threonine protein kinase